MFFVANKITNEPLTIGIPDKLDQLDTIRLNAERAFDISQAEFDALRADGTKFELVLSTNVQQTVPLMIDIRYISAPKWYGIVTGSLILFLLYFFIIFDVLHRTFAAILASSLSVAALSYAGERPTMHHMMVAIEADALLLLFSMMIIVAVIAKTGLFDYAAVFAYKVYIYDHVHPSSNIKVDRFPL